MQMGSIARERVKQLCSFEKAGRDQQWEVGKKR